MPIIKDPNQNSAQKLNQTTDAPSSPDFKDYGFLEGYDGHLMLYIKDDVSWPLIAGTNVEYDTETITFEHGGKELKIDIAVITKENPSPYVSLINEKVRKNIGKPIEKKNHYTVKLNKSDLTNKKIKE